MSAPWSSASGALQTSSSQSSIPTEERATPAREASMPWEEPPSTTRVHPISWKASVTPDTTKPTQCPLTHLTSWSAGQQWSPKAHLGLQGLVHQVESESHHIYLEVEGESERCVIPCSRLTPLNIGRPRVARSLVASNEHFTCICCIVSTEILYIEGTGIHGST